MTASGINQINTAPPKNMQLILLAWYILLILPTQLTSIHEHLIRLQKIILLNSAVSEKILYMAV